MNRPPLDGLRIVDLSEGVAGGYASKLLGDAGAEVIKAVGPGGDTLRGRGADVAGGTEHPLFRHLHAGHTVEIVDGRDALDRTGLRALVEWADVVIEGGDTSAPPSLWSDDESSATPNHARVQVRISPFGSSGPWHNRAANEFTLQGWSGKLATNYGGPADRPPAAAGGDPGLWLCGAFAAVSALAFHRVVERTGGSVRVDVSTLEAMVAVFGQGTLTWQLDGAPAPSATAARPREPQLPGIHAASDGLLAFAIVTAQQWFDFCVMIERPEWIADAELASSNGRSARKQEVVRAIDDWLSIRSVDEVTELAALLRIPVGVVASGATSPQLACYVDSFTNEPTGFVRPRAALRFSALLDDRAVRPPDPAPAPRPAALRLPLDGVRIADFTAFWAGPYASCVLALLGAEVVHVESPKRPDGMRTRSARPPSDPTWLEWSSIYHANNGSKRAISLDLDCESGLEVARRLVASCDGVIENFSPRVMDGFGLDGAGIARIRADSVCVRMPAFGLDNPWRDRPAFQHTIEPIAGIAWISGYADRDPQPIMICDGLGGVHAAFGMLCGLRHRDRVGEGVHVEVRLSEVAAAIAAEQVVTASARGETMQRIGNRHRWAGPQGVFGCAPDAAEAHHEWVAISVDGDEQWRGLLSVVGAAPGWATLSVPERRLLNDDIEQHLAQWCAARSPSEIVARLSAAGVPVAELSDGAAILQNPQLESRGFFTAHAHPICGSIRYPGLPFTAEMDGVVLPTGHRSYAPMWGEHDDQLAAWIGLDIDDAEQLRSQGVIGRGSTNLGLM